MQSNQSIINYIYNGLKNQQNIPVISFQGINLKKDKFFEHVEKLASYFVSIGIKKSDAIGICLPNFPSAVVAFYAINKVGGIINVIHPLMPPKGLVDMLNKTNTKTLIYFDRFYLNASKDLADNGINVILSSATDYLVGIQKIGMKTYNAPNNTKIKKSIKEKYDAVFYKDILKGNYPTTEYPQVLGEDVCLYLQSGGTTGEPKTVEITNFALNSSAAKTIKLTGDYIVGKDSMLMVLPIFHGFGIGVCVHTVLSAGLKIVMVPRFCAKKINRIIKRQKVTHLVGVPLMYDKLIRCKNFEGKHLKAIMNAYCGGDTLSSEIKDSYDNKVAKWGGESRLFEGYGLAEGISVCSSNTISNNKIGSVGKPLEGIQLKIVDESDKELSALSIGEICIAGDVLMKGYYKEQSDCIKVDNDNVRWLYTGDYGYLDEEGFLHYKGRKKRIIIIAGINVFPYEIESEVNKLEEISMSCAVSTKIEGRTAVRLFVELNKSYVFSQELKDKIIAILSKKLMKYAIPKEIKAKILPRTKLGKIDYKKLENSTEFDSY